MFLKNSILLILFLTVWTTFTGQTSNNIYVYPKENFNLLLFDEQLLYHTEKDTSNNYIQIQHQNNLGELSEVFESSIFGLHELKENQSLGLKFDINREGPYIGEYKPIVFYSNKILSNEVSGLSLAAGLGLIYEQTTAPGVLQESVIQPEGFIHINGQWKSSLLAIRLDQFFNASSNFNDYSIIRAPFATFIFKQRIKFGHEHLLSPTVEFKVYGQRKNYACFLFNYQYQGNLFAALGINNYSEIPLHVGGYIYQKKKTQIGTSLGFTKSTKTNNLTTNFDRINLNLFMKF